MRFLLLVQSGSMTWSLSAPLGGVTKKSSGSTLSIFHAQNADLASVSPQDAGFFAILGSLSDARQRHIHWFEAKYSSSFRLRNSDQGALLPAPQKSNGKASP